MRVMSVPNLSPDSLSAPSSSANSLSANSLSAYTQISESSIACTAVGVFVLTAEETTLWLLDGEIYHVGTATMLYCEEVGLEVRCFSKIIEVQYFG
jgi:hypothetical protein